MRVQYLSLVLGILTGMPLLADPFNYVTNGGFESGATSGVLTPAAGLNVYVFGVGGSTNIDGWMVSASSINNGSDTPLSVLVTGNPPQQPAGGTYAVDSILIGTSPPARSCRVQLPALCPRSARPLRFLRAATT